jgi:hypothetical protein
MKEAFDKEIDSLLRRHVGAGAEARAGGEALRGAQKPSHLDADELSAFAEGSLPAAARVAAVSHLADCDECRALAVTLSRAAGAEVELEKRAASAQVEPSRPARWRVWLSSLFAPRVLRYAAPALAACLVAAVSYVAWRSRPSQTQLARRASSSAANRPASRQAGEGDEADEGGQLTSNANASANTNASVAASEPSGGENEGGAERAAARATQARGPNAEDETQTATTTEPKPAEAPPPPPEEKNVAAAGAPQPAPASKPSANEPTEAAKTENKERDDRAATSQDQTASNDQPAQRQQQAKRSAQNNLDIVAPDDSRNQTRGATNNSSNVYSNNGARSGSLASTQSEERERTERGSGGAPAPSARRGRSVGESRAKSDEEDKDGRAEGTRSAAGHHFRRAGGAWVDVNYRDSMPSTGVRRGTDAYRALVADIPEIGRVADQLGGEVVVVVRGHAYRIR